MPSCPSSPASFREADLTDSEVEALILKFLLARGDATGRDIADQVKLPFVLVDALLREMKNEQLVVHRGSAPMNDFQYQLTDLGRERARRYSQHCTYFGSAPVSLKDYIASVQAQSLTNQHPTADDLHRAFDDLLLEQADARPARAGDQLGPRAVSVRPAGQRQDEHRRARHRGLRQRDLDSPRDRHRRRDHPPVRSRSTTRKCRWQPATGLLDQRKIDKRWVRIRRPTIVAGGELTMSQLEVTLNTSTGISEAPLQLKSNCGTLVIDDFGRQRMRIDELLNRWIVPLEKRYDFLNLPNGKKIQVPFDQLIIFSTNLEPRDLVDEAFLRRIPYKIEVIDPTEEEFRDLFELMAPKLGIAYRRGGGRLPDRHALPARPSRPFRFCQPRDLLLQVRNYCRYHNAAAGNDAPSISTGRWRTTSR